jgi:hypothetical protein
MTLTADTKKRIVIPGAAPGDVFACEQTDNAVILRRVYRKTPRKKLTKEQALKAIRRWKFKPAMSWEELRAMTRES